MINILDVGSSDGTHADWFKERGELNVTRLDIDPANHPDLVHDITKPFPEEMHGAYDIVLMSHVLEHIRYRYVAVALTNVVAALKHGGELWVLVPSMEWAAGQIIEKHETAGLIGTIWGGQADPYDFHYCGFTRNSLVRAMQLVGCENVGVREEPITVVIDGKEYPSMQLTAMGRKA